MKTKKPLKQWLVNVSWPADEDQPASLYGFTSKKDAQNFMKKVIEYGHDACITTEKVSIDEITEWK